MPRPVHREAARGVDPIIPSIPIAIAMPVRASPRAVSRRVARASVLMLVLNAACSLAQERSDPAATTALRPPSASAFWQGEAVPCPEAAQVPDPLHLADAVDIALCRNPLTRQSWARAKVQAAEVGIAGSDFYPQVDAAVSLQRSEVRNVPGSGGRTDLDASIGVDYLLFDFGGREANIERARQALLAANWTHDSNLQAVLFGAVGSYFQLYAAQEAVLSTRAAEQASLTSLEAARARLKAGNATRADVLQAQTAHSQNQLTRTRAEGEAGVALGVLANSLGLPAQQPLRIAPPPDLALQRAGDQAVEELIAAAREQRPDLAAAQAQVRAARSAIDVARAATRPSLSAFGSVGATQSTPGSDPRSGAIGLQLRIPIFTGYRDSYRVQQARDQLDLELANRDRLGNDVALDVWTAYQDLRTERTALDTSADLVASAQENYSVALGRYRAGVGTVTDLLNAQSALADAELRRIQARYRWNVSKAALARAIGVLQPALARSAAGAAR
ncbi:MAG: TolC family protein [Burkholderiales bacterium]|nr:TolC family protein [Burkholderiales bacterium]